jgi:phosphoribosylglycinamide formyltransferase 1
VNARLVVLASGTGTLLEALLDSSIGGQVVGLVSDQPESRVVHVAESRGIFTRCVSLGDYSSRESWESDLLAQVSELGPDLIIAAGFMRILSPQFVDQFPRQIINSHPSLLPLFPGAHAVRDTMAAGVKVTGCTVHFIDHGVDTGEIIAQQQVSVQPGESESELHERIKLIERRLLPRSIEQLIESHSGISNFGKGTK